MQIVCLGLSHKTAPVEVRERFAVLESHLGETALEIKQLPHVEEAVVVSTCNRVEFYTATRNPEGVIAALEEMIGQKAGDSALGKGCFIPHGGEMGIRHLFRVASGLESMVLGETEILGQVKKAYQAALETGATSRHLNKLFQRAFNVAKEVRTNTNITKGPVSTGSAAVELAEKIFGRLEHCKIMILGAGETAEMTAKALLSRGAKAIFVSNRTYERAHTLAESMGGKAIHFDAWEKEFHDLDILIGSTGAPHAVVSNERLAAMMAHRTDRPLFCIDLAVPRDFEPVINELEGVYLYDIDALQAIAQESIAVRKQELTLCERLIERHVEEFEKWLRTAPIQSSEQTAGEKALGERPLHAR